MSQQRRIVDQIDLHGFKKLDAISRLTEFIERVCKNRVGEVWVTVITGTGAHSKDGPVLRNAVQRLLEKRNMKFVLNKNKGSFTVQANSGHVLYSPSQPTDTKVLIEQASETIPRLPTAADRIRPSDYDPLPHEVAYAEKAIEESRNLHQESLREFLKEEKLLQKVLSMSKLEADQEENEEHETFTRVLSQSMQQSSIDTDDEDFLQALERSKTELKSDITSELERALSLSKLEAERNLSDFTPKTDECTDDEDEDLLKALQLSKTEEATRHILIEESILPKLQGAASDRMELIMQTSGAMLEVSPDTDAYGMQIVRVTGRQDSVELASAMIAEASMLAKAGLLSEKVPSPEFSGVAEKLKNSPSNGEGRGSSLQSFLELQDSCFKCSAQEFFKWLLSQDIDTLEALNEACEDDDYISVLQMNGLKGFKRGPFIRAVKAFCATDDKDDSS